MILLGTRGWDQFVLNTDAKTTKLERVILTI